MKMTDDKYIRIAFTTKDKMLSIFKLGKKFQVKQIWLTDTDLTSYHENMAYYTRKDMKSKKIYLTWIQDVKVFIQQGEHYWPICIKSIDDIPNRQNL